MDRMKYLLHRLFIPSDQNNYRARLLHHDFLTYYLVLAFVLSFSFKTIGFHFKNILGFATDISVQKLLALTNQQREKYGLSDLSYNDQLSQAAYKKAQDMFVKNYWAHFSPDGLTPWNFILSSNYQYEYAGENLAKNFLFSNAVVDAWMNSPSHRENMLKSQYSDVGYAVVNGVLNGEQTTLVVQMFGTPLSTPSLEKQEQTMQTADVPAAPVVQQNELVSDLKPEVLSKQIVQPKVNLFDISMNMNYIFIFFLAVILIGDFYVASKLNVVRMNGKNIAHLLFLLFISAAISFVIARSGVIL